MAELMINGTQFSIDVVVFDKDGTLIDFHIMWGSRAKTAVDALLQACDGGDELERALYRTMGYVPETGTTLGDGPLAVAPLAQADTIMATVLYQQGWTWHEAEKLIAGTFAPVMRSEPTTEIVQPLGQVQTTLEHLNARGVKTVMATTDNRDPTLKILEMLDISGYFDIVYCGDDEHAPKKPSPQVLREIAEKCQVSLDRIMMVGDTVGDLSMANAANAGARIGVRGGSTDDDTLAKWSHELVSSIDEIEFAPVSGAGSD